MNDINLYVGIIATIVVIFFMMIPSKKNTEEKEDNESEEYKLKEDEPKEDELKKDELKKDEPKEDELKKDEPKEDELKEDEQKKNKLEKEETIKNKLNENKDTNDLPFESKISLVTERERDFYKILNELAPIYNIKITPKVRLADIINVKEGTEKSYSYFNKIKAKHIDFLICNEDLDILAAIELDDRSHDTKARQQRDKFVNEALEAANIKIIHFRKYTRKDIEAEINALRPKICPNCNSLLVLRKNRRDGSRFFGCSTYPKCNHTEDAV